MTRAVTALFNSAVIYKAEPRGDLGGADLPLGLLLRSDLQNSSGRANLRAFDALGAAVASLERHLRLHQVLKVFGGPQNVIGADGDTELAGGAVFVECLDALGSERSD